VENQGSNTGNDSKGGSDVTLIAQNPGKISDFYEMDKKKLGEGSFGFVNKARHKSTKVTRACKTIQKAGLNNAKKREAFKKEIGIMKVLDHPNICKLFESFEDNRCVYLIMELCVGGELFDRIIELGHLKEVQAAILMQNMFRSIYYMHECHFTHRDLKPENYIFTTKEALEKSTLKLIDFGLAREYEQGQILATKAGTPYYVAPQVLAGKYDHQADMWSLGVIMYVILCGYPPFHGDTDEEVLQKVRSGQFTFVKSDWKGVSEDAQKLIRNLLKMNPIDRFTAQQALNDVWIKDKAPKAKDVDLHQSGIVDKLRVFRSQNKLKKAALHVIANSLDDKAISDLRDIFHQLDSNGDGQLTPAELMQGLENAGIKELPPDLEAILKDVDSDGSGIIDYSEFLAATLDKKFMTQENVCWQAFKAFDTNGDGKIDRAELAAVLQDDGVSSSFQKDLAELMKEGDTNGDGEIDFDEFMAMMRK